MPKLVVIDGATNHSSLTRHGRWLPVLTASATHLSRVIRISIPSRPLVDAVKAADEGDPPDKRRRDAMERRWIQRWMRELKAQERDVLRAAQNGSADVLEDADDVLATRIQSLLVNASTDGAATAISQMEEIGIGIDWALPNTDAAKWTRGYSLGMVKGINDTTRAAVTTAIESWIKRGAELSDLRDELSPLFGKTRAEMIAATEVTRAYAEGNKAVWEAAGIEQVTFRTARDEHVCSICGPLNGRVFDIGENTPPLHPRCILPGNEILTPGKISAAIKSFYKGRCVEVTTANGRRATVTENHPILTARGWVAAKFLDKTDKVVVAADRERISLAINPNDDHRPTKIEQIFDALKMSSAMTTRRMPVAPEDFHGDGRFVDGNVEIVWPNGFLISDIQSKRAKPFAECYLDWSGTKKKFLSVNGSEALLFVTVDTDFGSSVGIPEHPISHFWRCVLPARNHGFTNSARLYASIEKSFADSPSVNFEFVGESLFGFASDVASNDGVDLGKCVSHPHHVGFGSVTDRDPRASEMPHDGLSLDAILAAQFCGRFSREVALSDVVDIKHFEFSGHVYDLQVDPYHLYMCNDIIVSNCRCWLSPVTSSRRR